MPYLFLKMRFLKSCFSKMAQKSMLLSLAGNVDLDCILGIILLDASRSMKILNFEGKSRSIVISCPVGHLGKAK